MSKQIDLYSKMKDSFFRFLNNYSKIKHERLEMLTRMLIECNAFGGSVAVCEADNLKHTIDPLLRTANDYVKSQQIVINDHDLTQDDLKEHTKDLFIRFLDSYSKIEDDRIDILTQIVTELRTTDNHHTDGYKTDVLDGIFVQLLKQANVYVESKPEFEITFTEDPSGLVNLMKSWGTINRKDSIPLEFKNVLIQEKIDSKSDIIAKEYFAPVLYELPNYEDIVNHDLQKTYNGEYPFFKIDGLKDTHNVVEPISVYITLFQGVVDTVATDYRCPIAVFILDDNTEEPNTEIDGTLYQTTLYSPDYSVGTVDNIVGSLYNLGNKDELIKQKFNQQKPYTLDEVNEKDIKK